MSRDTPFVDFPAGSPVLREHEAVGALFIIEAGKVAIEHGQATIAELGPGDVFGEAALLQEHGHATRAVARTAVRALKLEVAMLPAVLRESVDVAMQLMRRLVQRLHAAEAMSGSTLAGAHRSAAAEAGPIAAPRAETATVADVAAPAAGARTAATRSPASLSDEITVPLPPPAVAPKDDAVDTRSRAAAAAPAAAPAPTAQAVPNGPAVVTHVLRHVGGVIALPGDKAECLVGRPDPATGAIPEINLGPLDLARSLSRRHARLFITGTTVSLREEPGVSNGTWVNGDRLAAAQQVILKPGDKLRFGAIELEFGTA